VRTSRSIELPRSRQSHTINGMLVRPFQPDAGIGGIDGNGSRSRSQNPTPTVGVSGNRGSSSSRRGGAAPAPAPRASHGGGRVASIRQPGLFPRPASGGAPHAVAAAAVEVREADGDDADGMDDDGIDDTSAERGYRGSVDRRTSRGSMWSVTPVKMVRRLSKENLQLHDRLHASREWTPRIHALQVDTGSVRQRRRQQQQHGGGGSARATPSHAAEERRWEYEATRLRSACKPSSNLSRPVALPHFRARIHRPRLLPRVHRPCACCCIPTAC
jgi:hypothetical protein